MCTLTVIQAGDAGDRRVRIECNRDESRLRPPARPPEQRTCGDRQVLMPVDPVSEGTWIGVNDAGLAAVLMNVYIAQAEAVLDIVPRQQPAVSRGTIIPHVLAADDLADAIARFEQLHPQDFEPFRLILVDCSHSVEIVWAAEQLAIGTQKLLDAPLFFTSSGLGDEIVANPRRELFAAMLRTGTDLPGAQDAFHRHVWPGREFASVWMTRAEARTQSITWCELDARESIMRYAARDAGDGLVLAEPRRLPLRVD